MRILLFIFFFSLVLFGLNAIDVWQFPEAADKNSLFIDVKFAGLSFTDGFMLYPPELSIDYVFPFFLPFSGGVYIKAPAPNLKTFGIRIGYHININSQRVNLYLLYVFDFGFLRNDLLVAYNDEAQPLNFYDFRAGVRYKFNKYLAFVLESGFKFQSINIGISIKVF